MPDGTLSVRLRTHAPRLPSAANDGVVFLAASVGGSPVKREHEDLTSDTDVYVSGIHGQTFYVNINSDKRFTKVVATDSCYAFEFDNVAYSQSPIPAGDYNGNGFITRADYKIWADHFGESNIGGADQSAAVPEPPTYLLLILTLVGLALLATRHPSRFALLDRCHI